MKKLILTLLMTGSVSLFAADAPFSSLTSLTSLASGDLFAVTDISDTTQSANGTSKKITATNVGAFYTDDSIYSSAWNGITAKAPSENVIYDYLHIGDADDDGKIDVFDSAAAGFLVNNSSGAFVASRSMAEGLAIDITNPTGAAGDPSFAFDPTELTGNRTWADGTDASILWTFNLTGTDPVITFGSGVVNVSTGTLQQGGTSVALVAGNIGAATATTPSAGDNDTSVATTAFVNTQTRGSNTGTHATPSTTNPLTLTFDAIMHAVWYGATGEIDMPAAASYTGRAFIVYNTGAFTITLDPNGSEIIVRDGTVQSAGISMTLSSGAGNYVSLISDGERWITLGYKGTLAAGS